MHVLHLIDSLGLGGAERMLVDIANATAATGQRVSVCVTRSQAVLAAELRDGIEVLVLDRKRRVSIGALGKLARWVRSRRVDVLHVHMRSSLSFAFALRLLFLVRTPIVFHDHYGSIEQDTSVPRWFRLGHPLIAKYVGVSDALARWARSAGLPAEKVTTISNALDLSRLTSAPAGNLREVIGAPHDVPIGILVASFKREKGIDVVIDAVAASKHRERMRVAIAGGGLESDFAHECRDRINRHGLTDTISLLGGRDDIASLLASADFGLLGSHSESGPLVLVEYLAKALPIVSTRVGDIGKRLAAGGVPGFVEPHDPAAFASALDELLDLTPAARAARAELGRSFISSGWDICDSIPRWLDIYEQALK